MEPEVTIDQPDEDDLESLIEIAPGVRLPRRVRARTTVDGTEVVIEIGVDHSGTGVVTVRTAGDGAQGLTGEMLRRIPLQKVARSAVRQAVVVDGAPPGVVGIDDLVPRAVVTQWPDGDDVAAFLRAVAHVYRVAEALGDPPTASVARAVGVSRATAGRQVDAARAAGLLEPARARKGR